MWVVLNQDLDWTFSLDKTRAEEQTAGFIRGPGTTVIQSEDHLSAGQTEMFLFSVSICPSLPAAHVFLFLIV